MSLQSGKQSASREVVVFLAPQASADAPQSMAGPGARPSGLNVVSAARDLGFAIRPLFPEAALHAPMMPPPAAPMSEPASRTSQSEELAAIEEEQQRYYVVHAESAEQAQDAIGKLNSIAGVSSVYVKPPVENPLAPPNAPPSAPTAVPDYSAMQAYLDAGPAGVGARSSAWAVPGGRGAGVRLIDIEGGWTLDHIELRGGVGGGLLGGEPFTDAGWTNHGTAVLGTICAADNGFGVTGIAPDASFNVISHQGLAAAGAIDLAANTLSPGDLLLLEMHRPGPRFNYETREDQQGYIAIEWWREEYLAIRRAVLRGIIVIEAAGNGGQDLDDSLYDNPNPIFPDTWVNPFRGAADSGAILVGAGAPPNGSFGPDRSRLGFSNFGSRIDCQGWGQGVVTTGYGELFGGTDDAFRTIAYTAIFSGTSSASPIVTGVAACLQGIARQRGAPLDPGRIRDLLRTTGSEQTARIAGGPAERIGNRPDLAALIAAISQVS